MGKSVTDERKSLQYQCHAQKGGAQCDQYTYDQCVTHERILKIHMKCLKHLIPPLPVR